MPAHLGLEVWMNGTRDELRAAWAALHRLGVLLELSDLNRLETAGRFRMFVRVEVATAAIPAPPRTPAPDPDSSTLPLAG